MVEDRWKRLDVWKMADELALKIYSTTKAFPKEEKIWPHFLNTACGLIHSNKHS